MHNDSSGGLPGPFLYGTAVLVLALSVLAIPFASRVGVDNRLELWVGEEGQERYQRFRRDFGSDEHVLVAATGRPLFEETSMDAFLEALELLEQVPQVSHVSGLPVVFRDVFGAENLDALEEEAQSTPFYRGLFLSSDAAVAGLLVETTPEHTPAGRRQVVEGINGALAPLERLGFRLHRIGPPVLIAALDEISQREMLRTLPVALAGSIAALLLMLRSVRATGVAIFCASIGILLTFGLMGLTGRPLNMISAALPSLLWVLGLANVIHLIRAYQEERLHSAANVAVGAAWARTWKPCTLSALTTAAGFASLVAATMAPVREVGFFAAAGILFCLAANLTFGPALLHLLQVPALRSGLWLDRWTARATRRSGGARLLVGSALLFAAMLSSLGFLQTRTDPLTFLPESSAVRQDYLFVGEQLGGLNTLELVIDVPQGWLNPESWPAIETLSRRLSEQVDVPRVLSPLDLLKKLNQWEHDFDPNYYTLPRTAAEAQRLVEELDEPGRREINRFVSPDSRSIRLSVLVNAMDSQALSQIWEAAQAALTSLPSPMAGHQTGIVLRLVRAQLDLVASQLRSFAWAFGVIFLCILTAFRSWRLTLASVSPNLLPVLSAFTLMAVAGLALDAATVMMASVALGIGVDNTVHCLAQYRGRRQDGCAVADSLRLTLATVGPAMVVTTVTASIGFFALGRSAFVPIRHFGLLSGAAVAIALAADLWLLPAVLRTMDSRSGGAT